MSVGSLALQVDGIEKLETAAQRIREQLSPGILTERVLVLARAAGEILKEESVRKITEMIYDMPQAPEVLYSGSGLMVHGTYMDFERTEDLKDSIIVTEEDGGFTQVVQVDPTMPVSDNEHSGREMVLDYAIPVHEGYMQFVFGTDTGAFHPGRPWFTYAGIDAAPKVFAFIELAFNQIVMEAIARL